MEKKIMIFGAGLNQLTLIQAAKRLGHESIVIDPNLEALGKNEADNFYCVDADDYNTTRMIAEKHNIDGIVTSQMQNPLRLMAKLADDLNLTFMKPDLIEKSLNKYLMKKMFIENGIPCAKGFIVEKSSELNLERLSNLKYPIIIKPTDSHSSRGVYKCESQEDLFKYLSDSKKYSTDGLVLLEEFIEGQEYSVESVTFLGQTKVIQITEKLITPYPTTVELRHIQPADLPKKQKDQIETLVLKVINALGIDNTASHAELKITPDGPVMIEIGPRLGGDFISSYLTKASTGVDMDEAAIQIALGYAPDLVYSKNNYACVKYIELEEGSKVMDVKDFQDLIGKNDDLIFAHIFVKKGYIIQSLTHSALRPGVIIVKADNRKELIEKVEYYEQKLKERIILE